MLAHRKYLSSKQLALWTLGLVAGSFLTMGLGRAALASLLFKSGLSWPVASMSSLVTISTAAVVFAAWMYRRLYRKPILLAFRELHFEVCVECGYRLQGLDETVTRCPECGAVREPMPPNARLSAESPP